MTEEFVEIKCILCGAGFDVCNAFYPVHPRGMSRRDWICEKCYKEIMSND